MSQIPAEVAPEDDILDLIWGVKAISQVIQRTPRQTFHLLETGRLPAKKVGNRWVSDRNALTKFFR